MAWERSRYSHTVLVRELGVLSSRLIASPMRFCHNDLLGPNVLADTKGGVRFIDYEYACYNARGFDLGNHFNEHAGFDLDYSRYPTRDQQMVFLKAYLSAFYERDGPHDPEEVEHLWREANQWSLASHFLWGVWALIQALNSSIDFDYLWYSNARLDVYFHSRDKYLTSDDFTPVDPRLQAPPSQSKPPK